MSRSQETGRLGGRVLRDGQWTETDAAMLWSAVGTKVLATALVGLGLGLITPVSWAWIAFTWTYCLQRSSS